MAAASAWRRLVRLETDSGLSRLRSLNTCKAASSSSAPIANGFVGVNKSGSSVSFHSSPSSNWTPVKRFDFRQISQLSQPNQNRVCLVDTLQLVKNLEAQGVPSQQAEAITSAIIEVLNGSLENVGHSFLSRSEMQQAAVLHESNLEMFKSEIKNSQEHHFSLLQRETEKLHNDMDKTRNDLRYELDKVAAGLRLDVNLEKGRMRDELSKHSAESTNLTNKIDREIHALRAQIEAGKYEIMKYCIGTLASIAAIGVAVIRIMAPDKK
ncbi:OLC1v1002256C1 [Oldenlandia corymbosa var. corymbosa]|uniref:OLC1v1002256C1 n=1 Tax=Oldenlandia corymbosa var. corymbosa TaxID=529605 RepID=A0AAV1D9P8_OLDCO|nr:OLC1v1002256C1 [Oldenlandia corymbosa var. corymbosa]